MNQTLAHSPLLQQDPFLTLLVLLSLIFVSMCLVIIQFAMEEIARLNDLLHP